MLLKLPQNVCFILDSLETNGFEAFAVGGCVRDMLMGENPHDFDVTTNALPDDVKAIFPHTADTGLKHGTVTVIHGGTPVEVTTYRTEGAYTDSRRPDNVQFVSDINLDLARRDFTVNAICYSPKCGLVDPYGGQQDINDGILRAVGDPETRFGEDALRILRLFRFSSKLCFLPEKSTLSEALKLSDTLSLVSVERISSELSKAATGRNPAALIPLIESGALRFIGLDNPKDISRIKNLPKREDIRLFSLLFLGGKDACETAKKLKCKNSFIGYCADMQALLSCPPPEDDIQIKSALKKYDSGLFFDLANFSAAIYGKDLTPLKDQTERILKSGEAYRVDMLSVGGKDLMKIGISGRDIGKTLDLLLDRVIAEPNLNTSTKLLSLACEIHRN